MVTFQLALIHWSPTATLAGVAGIVALIVVGGALLRWWGGPPSSNARRWPLVALRVASIVCLLMIIANPLRVTETPGAIERPDFVLLVDTSRSMAMGDGGSRLEQGLNMIRAASAQVDAVSREHLRSFRFGQRLVNVDSPAVLGQAPPTPSKSSSGSSSKLPKSNQPLQPSDTDTQLGSALRQLPSRFGSRPPTGVLLISDGRVRDEVGLDALAAKYRAQHVPVHVLPVGEAGKGGDVAIVAVVVPSRVRRFSEVEVQVFLRSYGYNGNRAEITITAPNEQNRPLTSPTPVILQDGFQSLSIPLRSDAKSRQIAIAVSTMTNEIAEANNRFLADITVDRTKIRVLYLEGSTQPRQSVSSGNDMSLRGPYSDLVRALTEDDDIECVALASSGGRALSRVGDSRGTTGRLFPESVAELSAYDALIISDVAAESLSEAQQKWIEDWVRKRGAGLMMVGGQRSFAAGRWQGTPVGEMLPVELTSKSDWVPGTQVKMAADPAALAHPLWKLSSDDRQNQQLVQSFPGFFGANQWAGVKSELTRVLANSDLSASDGKVRTMAATPPPSTSLIETLQRNLLGGGKPKPATPDPGEIRELTAPLLNQPSLVAGQYGKGRTLAMAVPITAPWASDFITKWGDADRGYGRFWRNTVYWLTENSAVGRRRLIATADKKYYQPGEAIQLTVQAFDENARMTNNYQILGLIDPHGPLQDVNSAASPVKYPEGLARTSGETGPFLMWAEEFQLPKPPVSREPVPWRFELPLAEAFASTATHQSLRLELVAQEGATQVDSTSLDLQVLSDPFEQQNPFPNHQLLAELAKATDGKVITSPEMLAEVWRAATITHAPPVIHRQPAWSSWWLWFLIIGLMTADWLVRRVIGMA